MIRHMLVNILQRSKSAGTSFLFGQLSGWKLVGLYAATIAVSISFSSYFVYEELVKLVERSERYLQNIQSDHAKKSAVAADYRRVQQQFDVTILKKPSCVNTLTPADPAWNNCVSRQAVLARLKTYELDNASQLAGYDDINYSLGAIARQLAEQPDLGPVKYTAISVNKQDVLPALLLQLELAGEPGGISGVVNSINTACANCKVRLVSFESDGKNDVVAKLDLSIYFDDEASKTSIEDLEKAVDSGQYSDAAIQSFAN